MSVHKNHKRTTASVRCSVVLPHALLDEAKRLAPPSLRSNVNRLVVVSLEEFLARRRGERFEGLMAEMPADQAVRSECASM